MASTPALPTKFTTSVQAITGSGYFAGAVALDTSAAANTITVYDGTDATGIPLASFDCAASKSGSCLINTPVKFAAGLFVATTGACKGSVFVQ